MQSISRRGFLKLGGATTAGLFFLKPLEIEKGLKASPKGFSLKKMSETVSICAYCAGGCGILVGAESGQLVSIEGDPEHPVNQGALCSKAQSLYQIRTVNGQLNPRRLTKVLYRAPNSTAWEEKSWDWALDEIAKRIKNTRDANWVEKDKDGILVNRTEAIAQLGGSAHDNEECYLISKMNRALGLVYTETQARI